MSSTSSSSVQADINDEQDLRRVFAVAEARFRQIANSELPSAHPDLQQARDICFSEMQACAIAANQLQMFSPNETIDDVNTENISFLMLPFYLGVLHQDVMGDGRGTALKEAENYFRNFLSICQMMGGLKEDDVTAMERQGEPTREEKRNELISMVRREKNNQQKREEIERRKATMCGADSETSVEELERDLKLTVLDDSVMQALKDIAMIRQELPMIEYMQKLKAQGELESFRETQQREQEQAQNDARIAAKKNREQGGTFGRTITSVTEEEARARGMRVFQVPDTDLRKKLLKPWWRQPTMSLDELAEIEMQRMVTGGGGQEERVRPEEEDEEAEQADDNESYHKMRAKDEFNDDNPTGWGNRMNQG